MERVRLKVFGLSYDSMSHAGAYALILAEENNAFRIPIIIGVAEAQSIAIQLEKLHSRRPLTHDLMKNLADELGAVLEEVYIYRWEAGIFYSELRFKCAEKWLKIDSRTSDAIALALRYNCPIYVANSVIDQTAIPVSDLTSGEYSDDKAIVSEKSRTSSEHDFTIEELTRLLDEAVKSEDYENASRFRDMLKAKKGE